MELKDLNDFVQGFVNGLRDLIPDSPECNPVPDPPDEFDIDENYKYRTGFRYNDPDTTWSAWGPVSSHICELEPAKILFRLGATRVTVETLGDTIQFKLRKNLIFP